MASWNSEPEDSGGSVCGDSIGSWVSGGQASSSRGGSCSKVCVGRLVRRARRRWSVRRKRVRRRGVVSAGFAKRANRLPHFPPDPDQQQPELIQQPDEALPQTARQRSQGERPLLSDFADQAYSRHLRLRFWPSSTIAWSFPARSGRRRQPTRTRSPANRPASPASRRLARPRRNGQGRRRPAIAPARLRRRCPRTPGASTRRRGSATSTDDPCVRLAAPAPSPAVVRPGQRPARRDTLRRPGLRSGSGASRPMAASRSSPRRQTRSPGRSAASRQRFAGDSSTRGTRGQAAPEQERIVSPYNRCIAPRTGSPTVVLVKPVLPPLPP